MAALSHTDVPAHQLDRTASLRYRRDMPTGVTKKTVVGSVDGTPSKQMFWSIMSDYDLFTAIFELVDNAIDMRNRSGRADQVAVSITLDIERQRIDVMDNAG